jgi:hypothetical protein
MDEREIEVQLLTSAAVVLFYAMCSLVMWANKLPTEKFLVGSFSGDKAIWACCLLST